MIGYGVAAGDERTCAQQPAIQLPVIGCVWENVMSEEADDEDETGCCQRKQDK
jgi:hypothetical protein